MIIGILAIALLIGAVGISYSLSAPGYEGAVSDHFDGKEFRNREPVARPNPLKALAYFATAQLGPWEKWTENTAYPAPPARVGRGDMRVTFINHSTVLIQMDSLNILTDPIWAERCSPFSFAGPPRRRAPGLELKDLPSIDIILLSHNHYDHMDIVALKRLAADHNPRIITGLGNRALLQREGIGGATEMDWDQQLDINSEVRIYGLTARHFSNRGMFDQNRTLWLSFVIKGPAGAVYFAGDTGFGAHFGEAGKAFGPFRLALLPIGAYLPRWFMKDIHLSPDEAVLAHQALNASTSAAIHFGTFQLSAESQRQPIEELRRALENVPGEKPRFWALDFGEGREVPPLSVAE